MSDPMRWHGQQHAGQNPADIAVPCLQLALAARSAAEQLHHLTRAYSWALGCAGEQQVANRLAALPRSDWTVLHGIPLGGGRDIDHLIISRAGVFVVDTKVRRGSVEILGSDVEVNGIRTGMLSRVRELAARASAKLSSWLGASIEVTPVIALIADRVAEREKPAEVHVLREAEVVPWLQAHQPRLPQWKADKLAWASCAPSTWS